MQIDTYQDRDEWLAARSADYGVGASTVPAMLGLSGFTSPWDVWARWHAPEAIKQSDESPQLVRGHLLEPHLLKLYAKRMSVEVQHHDYTVCSHDTQRWARFSPDGIVADGGLVEIKTARNGWMWREAPEVIETAADLEYLPNPAYGIQCYWQMLISGAPYCDLVVLPLGNDLAAVADAIAVSTYADALELLAEALASALVIVRVLPDPDFTIRMGAKVAAWRDKHLIGGAEPESRGVAAPRHHGELPKFGEVAVDVDHPVTELADALFRAKADKRHTDSTVKTYTAKLKQAMQHVTRLQTPRGAVSWRKHGRGRALAFHDWLPGEAATAPADIPILTPNREDNTDG